MSKRIGSTLDSLFEELGEREEVDLLASKKTVAATIGRQMAARQVSQVELASRMRTSRSQVHRLLDPTDTGVTLGTIARASRALGLRFSVKIAPERARTPSRTRVTVKKARASRGSRLPGAGAPGSPSRLAGARAGRRYDAGE